MPKNYSQLSLDERRTIYKLLEAGRSKTSIANYLGRHRATIFREVRRNSFYLAEDQRCNGYSHVNAHEFATRRRSKLRKLIRYPELKAFVISKLQFPWSPDQIAGYLKRLGIDGFYVCRETIYDFIYSSEGRALKLYRYLRKAFKNRRKRFTRKPRNLRGIPQKLDIHNRPDEVNYRENFGHWEGDLMIFRREYGNANITSLVERKSRYTYLIKNQNRRSEPVMSKIRDKLITLPHHSRCSVTFDRGSEFLAWKLLKKHVALGSYYCDPQAPWQKGTNENTNGRVRQFLPRDTNINEISQAQINKICKKLNHTPRRCLNYRTPHEVFYNHLHQVEDQITCLP
jgi:IS30 family transposase